MRRHRARRPLAIALLVASVAAQAFDIDEVENGVFRVVNVQDGKAIGSGSGFAVDERHILTNDHVVRGADSVYIVSPLFEDSVRVRLLDTHRDYDVALLRVEGRTLDPLVLSTQPPDAGSAVFALGYPGMADIMGMSPDDPVTVTGGVFSRLYQRRWLPRGRELTTLQHNADISGGNSGGPLIDACNRVIGINTQVSGVNPEEGTVLAQGLGWASAIRHGIEVLRDNGIRVQARSNACESSGSGALEAVREAQEAARSAAEQAMRDNRALRKSILHWGGIALIALAVVLAVVFVIVSAMMRRQNENLRQAMKRAAEPVSRPFRRGGGRASRTDDDSRPHRAERARPAKGGLVLTGIGPDGAPLRIALAADELATADDGHCIGRHPELVDTVIADESVSRRHARVSSDGNAFRVEDLNSTRGTTVNRSRIRPFEAAPLKAGDRLSVGGVELVVSAL